MADKISTLVMTVDLDCKKCKQKIKKALCKIHEIEQQTFDKKQKKVTISGPFNPDCLIQKLYCKLGCKIITAHEIIKTPPPKKSDGKPKPDDKKPDGKPKPDDTKPDGKPKPIHVAQVNVAQVCICGRPCGGACTCRERGRCRPLDYEVCWRRDNCCSPCREGRPWDGICTKGGYQYGNSYHFFSEEDRTCKIM